MYRCSRCGRVKASDQFYKDDRNLNHHRGVCIICNKLQEIQRRRSISQSDVSTQNRNLTMNVVETHNTPVRKVKLKSK